MSGQTILAAAKGQGAMDRIADYKGGLLNHLETLYRPGDRELALELVEALGLTTVDTGFATYVAVHPNGEDRNRLNNVMFLSEMLPQQAEIEAVIAQRIAADPALRAAIESYRDKARTEPFGIPHFGLRYPSAEALAPVLDKLGRLSPALKERVTVNELPPMEVPVEGFPDVKQVFVYTDVFTAGGAAYGQMIELQVER
jgi:hypothetical protein